MIKANELRLGNYFLWKCKPKKVKHIWPYGVGITTEEGDDWTQVLEIEDIEPIPLTLEILEGAGFENWNKNKYANNVICLTLNGDGFLYLANQRHVNLFYLHQLQNLYFSLTGEELNIKL
jgi:hypothetical protein